MEIPMGNLNYEVAFTKVLPEIIVRQGESILLVQGSENGAVFWWPPGAYWLSAATCDLTKIDPIDWINKILKDQVGLESACISLRGVSIIDQAHSPVLLYDVEVSGEPRPNERIGFRDAKFFERTNLPEALGRDHAHGAWLRKLALH
jgi:hypothetical protein